MVFITSHVSGYRKILIVKPQPISERRDPMIPNSSRYHEATKVCTGQNILNTISLHEGSSNDVCLWHEGKPVHSDDEFSGDKNVVATLRLRGGKGGFGSMLRAIGAQIEKTTNREACRDLSGRRLRDINEEKRLKEFLSKKVEKEKEMLENKRKKLEQMKDGPKHTFEDKAYFEQREKRESDIYTSLDKAFTKTGEGSTCIKNKKEKPKEKPRKSRMISDLDDSSSDEDSESDEDEKNEKEEADKEIESAEEHKETGGEEKRKSEGGEEHEETGEEKRKSEEREGKRKSEEGESEAKRSKSS